MKQKLSLSFIFTSCTFCLFLIKKPHYDLQRKAPLSEFQLLYCLSVPFSLPLFPCYSPTCAVLKVSQIPIEGKASVEATKVSEYILKSQTSCRLQTVNPHISLKANEHHCNSKLKL